MYKNEVVLENETGLHARPASIFVEEAARFSSDIKLIKGGKEYNAKSIMSVMSADAGKGTSLTIIADGADEKEAVEALIRLVVSEFNGFSI